MEREWEAARTTAARRVWPVAIVPLAETVRTRAPELAAAMTERVVAGLPEVLPDPDARQANRTSNEANLLLIADLLERRADPYSAELPQPTVALAAIGAHRNLPLSGLLRIYRIGHALGLEAIGEILRDQTENPEDRALALELVTRWLLEYIDAATCLAEDFYARERERWVRTAAAARAEAVDAILSGAPVDSADASLRLGYVLDRTHVAAIAWLEGDGEGEPLAILERALDELARTSDAERPLVHALGEAAIAAWFPIDAPLEVSGSLPAGVRVATGTPAAAIDGFRRSFAEAADARRVASHSNGQVTRYADVAVVALATADPDRAAAFVSRQLGPLANADETTAKLTETLRAYLDEGASHGRAANRLAIHENTVRYRVRQAEDLLGHPVLPGNLDLRVALELLRASRAGSPRAV
jgi:DNA-binding PucR family transcriptional regulator